MPERIRFSRRSVCPVANTLDVLGDKWTLLVVRDMLLLGKRRFGELLRSDEAIPTNILADRLRRLEEAGIVRRRAYQRRPARYEYLLTRRGADLFSVLREIVRWGNQHLPRTATAPPGWLERAGRAAVRAAEAADSEVVPGSKKSPKRRQEVRKTLRNPRRI